MLVSSLLNFFIS